MEEQIPETTTFKYLLGRSRRNFQRFHIFQSLSWPRRGAVKNFWGEKSFRFFLPDRNVGKHNETTRASKQQKRIAGMYNFIGARIGGRLVLVNAPESHRAENKRKRMLHVCGQVNRTIRRAWTFFFTTISARRAHFAVWLVSSSERICFLASG